jgi:hypothetical protein
MKHYKRYNIILDVNLTHKNTSPQRVTSRRPNICPHKMNKVTSRLISSAIAVTFINSRLGGCLVKRDLISAGTDKRLRAVEHWSQKRVKRGLFEERFLATSSAAPFLTKRAEKPLACEQDPPSLVTFFEVKKVTR